MTLPWTNLSARLQRCTAHAMTTIIDLASRGQTRTTFDDEALALKADESVRREERQLLAVKEDLKRSEVGKRIESETRLLNETFLKAERSQAAPVSQQMAQPLLQSIRNIRARTVNPVCLLHSCVSPASFWKEVCADYRRK